MIEERTGALSRLHAACFPRPEPNGKPNGHRHRDTLPLDDDRVVELCRRAANSEKFERLFDLGDAEAYGGDDSRADQALVGVLAFYTRDPEQLDRLFRRSRLYRPEKWGSRPDYRRRTIENALSRSTETYAARGAVTQEWKPNSVSPSPSSKGQGHQGHPLRATRFAEMGEPKKRRYVVEGLVPEAYPVVVFGSGGVAKSALMLSACTAIAANVGGWLGVDAAGGPVLYLDFELDADEQNRRAHLLARGAGLEKPPDDLFYISALGRSPDEAFGAALEACEEYGAKMVVLDSWGPALEGDALAARDIIGFFRRQLEPFRAAGIAVVIVDHQAKLQAGEGYQGKSAFGSVYKTNLARSIVQVELAERGEGTITVKLRQVKSNFGPLAEPFGAKLTFGDNAWTVEATELDAASLAGERSLNAGDRVRLALEDGPAFPWEVSERTELALKTVKNELSKLRKAGKVKPTGEREGQAEQVSLVSPPHRDGDGDTRSYRIGEAVEARPRQEVAAV